MSNDSDTPPEVAPAAEGADALPDGTILAGRYRVSRTVGTAPWALILEGTDEAMRGRRVVIAVVSTRDRERHISGWLDIDCPETAPLLDVVALDRRVAGVFDIDDNAETIQDVVGLSRAQRAALVVSAARALEHARAAGVPTRFSGQGQLWVEGAPDDVRLRVLPVPDFRADEDDVLADELAATARLTTSQLFGIDPITPPSAALDVIPEALAPVLAPLYADDPAVRRGAPPIARALATALSVGSGASSVPVPSAAAPSTSAQKARLSGAQHRARRLTIREYAVSGAMIAIAAAVFFPLLSTEDHDITDEAVEPLATPLEVKTWALPIPTSVTLPPSDLIWPVDAAALYATVVEDGPMPRGVGPMQPFAVPNWQSHVRIFYSDDGYPIRVEQFAAGRLYLGYVVYRYDAAGRVVRRDEYGSTGVPRRSRTYDYAAGTYQGRLESGELEVPGCYSIAFELDSAGRFSTTACQDHSGRPALTLEGYHSIVFEYDPAGGTSSRRFLDIAGDPARPGGGPPSIVERRDELGRIVGYRYFDDGRAVVDAASGAAAIDYVYEARTLAAELYDESGAPVHGVEGWFRKVTYYGQGGGPISLKTFGVDGRLLAGAGTTIATVEYSLDERNLIVEERWFDAEGEATVNKYGVHRVTYVRDDHDNVLRECSFGLAGPVATPALGGAHCVVTGRDFFGRGTSEAFYGLDGAPTRNDRVSVHRVELELDDRGRVAARRYYDERGAPMRSWANYHGVRFEYDDFGVLVLYSYIDESGALAEASNGVARVVVETDPYGREVRRCFFDTGGERAVLREGFGRNASCIEWEFRGLELEQIRYLGDEEQPVLAAFENDRVAAVIQNEYLPDGRLGWQRYFDVDGVSQLGEVRDCTQPLSCIGERGWSWHLP